MTRYVGVKCKTCETTLALASQGTEAGKMAFFAIPLEPILCKICGSSYLYGPEDRLDFEGQDGLVR
jgi:hypothetical protein